MNLSLCQGICAPILSIFAICVCVFDSPGNRYLFVTGLKQLLRIFAVSGMTRLRRKPMHTDFVRLPLIIPSKELVRPVVAFWVIKADQRGLGWDFEPIVLYPLACRFAG